MPLVTPWPSIRQALIRQLRSNLVLAEGLPGDWAEGFAPQKTPYPLGVVYLHYAPSVPDTTGRVIFVGAGVVIFAKDPGVAASLYQLAFTSLNDTVLALTGQTSLQCRESSSISLQDVDAEGKAVYEVGAIYEIRVAQSNPALRTLVFSADSTISS